MTTNVKNVFGAVLAACLCGWAQAADFVRERASPTRVVWTSGSVVSQAETLLKPKHGQVPEAGWNPERMWTACCVLTNANAAAGLVLDFGCELHGGLRLAVSSLSSKKMKMRVRFGESVSEVMSELGEKGACNDHAIRDSVIDLPTMGTREIGNTGFRFVRLDLVTPGRVALEAVEAISLTRQMRPVGSFRSSDARLDRIFETAVRTVHLCCQDYLWDGIKRDRLVWMGDMHPETMAILSVFGADDIIPETLALMAKVTPPDEWMNGFPTYTLCWIRNLAAWCRYTGDRKLVDEMSDYLEKTFGHVASMLPNGIWKKEGAYGAFLDWPTHHQTAAELAGAQGLAVLAVEDVKFLAETLGRADLVIRATDLLGKMRQAKPEPHGAKSVAAMLALSGLREPKEMHDLVLGQDGHAGVSTFYGYYMLEAMSLAGQGRRALETVRDYWGAMLDVGATTFWEDFNLSWTNNCFRIDELPVEGKKDIHGDCGDFCYKGFRHSLCHGWSAGPAAWCINRVLGIRPVSTGCKTVEVKPCLADLAWAEGSMALPTGESVKVRAERGDDGIVRVDVSAPHWVKIEK